MGAAKWLSRRVQATRPSPQQSLLCLKSKLILGGYIRAEPAAKVSWQKARRLFGILWGSKDNTNHVLTLAL